MNRRLYDFGLAGVWLAVDQVTKIWAGGLSPPVVVVPGFFRLALSHNRGALFGMLGEVPDPWRTVLLTGLPLLAITGIFYLIARTPRSEIFARTGLALILGGAIGNVIDRVLRGHVVDFLDLYASWPPIADRLIDWFGTNRWPTFNVADIGLTCGATLLLIEIFFRGGARKAAADTAGTPEEDPAGASLPR